MGTAPESMTAPVFSEVPDAMLVSAHAASYWSCGNSSRFRNSTKYGTTPARITSSIAAARTHDARTTELRRRLELRLRVVRLHALHHLGQRLEL